MPTLHGALIQLFALDLAAQGGGVFRWANDTNEFGTNLVWQGHAYPRMPIEATGFDISGTGKLPRPSLRIGNVDQVVGGLTRQYGDLIGCKVTRHRTFAKYLDAANFTNGNPTADPAAEFPLDVFYIDRKVSETKLQIEWELVAALDLPGVMLPRRQIVAAVCPYPFPPTPRHAECPYVGALTTCDHTIGGANGCKVHFGATADLPFGGFPGAGQGRR